MDRRSFVAGAALAGVAALAGSSRLAAAPGARHAEAMAAAKARIRRLGARLKASNWTDLGAKRRLAAEARVYAGHHRALALLEGRA